MTVFSTKTFYGLKALMELCRLGDAGGLVSLAEISAKQSIPLQYLEQIMLNLKQAGFVESRRGASGGFHLRLSAEAVTVSDVIRSLESREERRPLNQESPAADDQVLFEIADRARAAAEKVFGQITLRALYLQAEELKRQNEALNFVI